MRKHLQNVVLFFHRFKPISFSFLLFILIAGCYNESNDSQSGGYSIDDKKPGDSNEADASKDPKPTNPDDLEQEPDNSTPSAKNDDLIEDGELIEKKPAKSMLINDLVRFETLTPARFQASEKADGLQWSFSDGSSANGSEVQHSFNSPGRYTVELAYNGKSMNKKSFVVFCSKRQVENAIAQIKNGTFRNSDDEINKGEQALKNLFGNSAPLFLFGSRANKNLEEFTNWAIVKSEDLREKGLLTQKPYAELSLNWKEDGFLQSIQINE